MSPQKSASRSRSERAGVINVAARSSSNAQPMQQTRPNVASKLVFLTASSTSAGFLSTSHAAIVSAFDMFPGGVMPAAISSRTAGSSLGKVSMSNIKRTVKDSLF
jgi:hypothetical protein